MAGYIGKSQGVTQVDGYNRTEADGRYVNASGDTMTGNLTITDGTNAMHVEVRNGTNWTGRFAAPAVGKSAIQYFNGSSWANGIEVDSAGRVTMPYQPAFNATALSYEVLGSGWQLISYNQSVSQRGSSYNATTSTFTASVSGWYQFNASWSAVNNSDIDGTFALGVNGSIAANFGTVSMSNTGANYDGHVISACTYLAANDYVNVWRYSTVQTTTREYDWTGNFSGYLIG